MTDHFIEKIAKKWKELGGTSEGVTYAWMCLRSEVRRLEVNEGTYGKEKR